MAKKEQNKDVLAATLAAQAPVSPVESAFDPECWNLKQNPLIDPETLGGVEIPVQTFREDSGDPRTVPVGVSSPDATEWVETLVVTVTDPIKHDSTDSEIREAVEMALKAGDPIKVADITIKTPSGEIMVAAKSTLILNENGEYVHEFKTLRTEYIEGFGLVDLDSGELIEADGEDVPAAAAQALNKAAVAEFGESDVEWSTSKVFRMDSDILAAKTRLDAEIEAIKNNWQPEVNRLKRMKDAFLKWVSPSVAKYAEAQLLLRNTKKDGSLKASLEKSIKFPKASLSFRTKPGKPESVVVADGRTMDEAIKYVQDKYPEYVHLTPSIDWNRFTGEDREALKMIIEMGSDCPLAIVESIPPVEEFSIKTGIKL